MKVSPAPFPPRVSLMSEMPESAGRLRTALRASRSVCGAGAVVLLALLVCWLMYRPWLGSAEQPRKPKDEEFAADRALPDPAPFNPDRAMGYLRDVCKIGPRISGSDGMRKQQELLEKHFKDLGGKETWQRFQARQRSMLKPEDLANLVVSCHPDRRIRVIVCW